MISLRSVKSRVVVFALLIGSLCSVFLFLDNSAFADCSDGYCYSTGGDPLGGQCGNGKDGPYWDTCFGLSWQYYEWPSGYTGDISFHGTHNAGYATVSSECAQYGGFWFLGYEVYNPKTGNSYGYQVGAPRVKMLKDYDPVNGYTRLYYVSKKQPANNPYIKINGKYLHAKRYGNADDMFNIKDKFDEYIANDRLVSDDVTDFSEVNWFCSEPTVINDPDNVFNGSITASINGIYAVSDGENDGKAEKKSVTINEGESIELYFAEDMSGNGEEPQTVEYHIFGDAVNGPEPDGSMYDFYDYVYDHVDTYRGEITRYYSVPRRVSSRTMTVSEAGEYCETLEFGFNTDSYSYSVCIDVEVEPAPPDFYGRITASAIVLDESGDPVEGSVQAGTRSATTEWNGAEVVVVPITVDYNQTVSVKFDEDMKGIGDAAAQTTYTITNSFIMNERRTGPFIYGGTEMSNSSVAVSQKELGGISKDAYICETMSFRDERGDHTVSGCVDITLGKRYPDLSTEPSKSGDFTYSVEIDPQISVTLQKPFVTATGDVNTFLRDKTTVRVASNNLTGYNAVMTTGKNSSDTNATSLVHENVLSGGSIPTLTEAVARSEFPSDRWGFSFNDTTEGNSSSTYRPLVALDSNQPIVVLSNNAPAVDTQDLYFATKADVARASGAYANSIVVRAVANVLPIDSATISDITYMQEINDSVIDSMTVDQQYRLKDQRDNKDYWIVKLSDGTVWMSQNLDLALPGSLIGDNLANAAYTNGTTDLTYGDSNGNKFSAYAFSRDFSDIQLYRAASDINIGKAAMFSNSGPCYNAGCTVYDVTPYDYYIGTDDAIGAHYQDDDECASVLNISVNDCSHYHIGTLYSSNIAIGANSYIPSDILSICPRGWRLPESSDFAPLQDMISEARNNNNTLSVFDAVPQLYLVGDVYYDANNKILNSLRNTKQYWVSAVEKVSGNTIKLMTFTDSGASIVENSYANYYYPVRCVARTGN